jgi:hypothetical protein
MHLLFLFYQVGERPSVKMKGGWANDSPKDKRKRLLFSFPPSLSPLPYE